MAAPVPDIDAEERDEIRREEREQRKKDRRNERELKEGREKFEVVANSIIFTLESKRRRRNKVKDTATRNIMLTESIMILVDTLSGFARAAGEHFKVDSSIKDRLFQQCDNLQTDIEALNEWIMNPTYGPDHPYGRKMMRDAEEDFEDKQKSREKGKDE